MGKKSRTKGASGERDVCTIDAQAGFESKRTAPMQAGHGDAWADVECGQYPLSMFRREVKRYRRTPVNRFVKEYVEGTHEPGEINTLVWRDDSMDWMVTFRYSDFLQLLSTLRSHNVGTSP